MLYKEITRSTLVALFTLFACVMTTNVSAHGGVAVSIDTCRIPVGDQWVHFTGYTPQQTADTEYCNDIPNIGYTNLVFDYEGRVLTKMTVEFQITKEPEGTEIYYDAPKIHQTGTVLASIDFSKPELGEGDYLAHVTLVNEGEKIDAHLPFSVSTGSFTSGIDGVVIAVIFIMVVILGAFYFTSRRESADDNAA